MKEFNVDAFFPEVPSHAANQSVIVRASRLDLAAKKGVAAMMRRPHVKGKRIKTVRVTVAFIREVPVEWVVKTYKVETPPDTRETMHEVVEELGPFREEAPAFFAADEWKKQNGRPAWAEKREVR